MNKISWGYDVDGSLWTEVCGRKFVDGSCGRKLWTEVVDRRRKLWTVDGNDFRSSFSVEIDLMELKMTSKYVKEYSDLKKMDITVLKATK